MMESLSKALTPLAELTDFCLVKISSVLPALYILSTKLLCVEEHDTELTKNIKKNIVDDLKSHYEETEVKELLKILTYLEC